MTSSLRDQVNDLLTEYTQVTQKYFQSLISVAENNDHNLGPETYIQEMINVDERLQKALDQIGEHQARQQQIKQVQDEIQQHQTVLLSMVEKLNTASQELDNCLSMAKKELKATEYAQKANIQFTDVLSYASKLSKYTSAPPNFDLMNRDIKVDFEKPYPDEERMRRGLLYWQHSTQPIPEDKFESSDNESASDEDDGKKEEPTKKPEEDGPAPFWILDLNPNMST
ncbi:vitamin-D-receptor interacting mediator subunit 4-domain-containing protein [Halteromyces radiatus]|uniref:vitamin-D-receptor interacting mediator subunit 4-domain-containing protein n=1 Tax=Halteromyces radiatus TaxID=101107 RepID=UPI00221E4CBA|nr:vitamin-D-receptor interacting mediator subunit 4-domain-containing protein [Halteromyces radiatus]KAI8098518.1 vitamin-D-receptor interacting mediator subunit 4-domain-containing protein [Halteromyces radiatus]